MYQILSFALASSHEFPVRPHISRSFPALFAQSSPVQLSPPRSGLLSGELSCADVFSPPSKSVITEAWNVSGVDVGVVFECETGFGWASGKRGNFAQCLNNNWTAVDDACHAGKEIEGCFFFIASSFTILV